MTIFILHPSLPTRAPGALKIPMVDNGLTPVIGRLWFTSAAVISARYVDLPKGEDQDRIDYVVEYLALGNLPALIFDPRPLSRQLRLYRRGLSQLDDMEPIPLEGEVSPGDVFEAIDDLYKASLITPALSSSMSPWKAPRHHRPREDAESRLQTRVRDGLAMKFPLCVIRPEQPQVTGRTDLEIEQQNFADPTTPTRCGILELKVLRSYWSSGARVAPAKTKEWIADGVTQVAAYCLEKPFRWSALCCFDMRESDEGDAACFAHVQEEASDRDVLLKRWFLYASVKAYRQALMAAR